MSEVSWPNGTSGAAAQARQPQRSHTAQLESVLDEVNPGWRAPTGKLAAVYSREELVRRNNLAVCLLLDAMKEGGALTPEQLVQAAPCHALVSCAIADVMMRALAEDVRPLTDTLEILRSEVATTTRVQPHDDVQAEDVQAEDNPFSMPHHDGAYLRWDLYRTDGSRAFHDLHQTDMVHFATNDPSLVVRVQGAPFRLI